MSIESCTVVECCSVEDQAGGAVAMEATDSSPVVKCSPTDGSVCDQLVVVGGEQFVEANDHGFCDIGVSYERVHGAGEKPKESIIWTGADAEPGVPEDPALSPVSVVDAVLVYVAGGVRVPTVGAGKVVQVV